MGEGSKRARAKSYRQELVEAGGEAFEKTLLSAIPVQEEIHVECVAKSSDKIPEIGEPVNLIDRGGQAVEVYHASLRIGDVHPEGTAFLRDTIKIQERPAKHISGVVVKTDPAWCVFVVQLCP